MTDEPEMEEQFFSPLQREGEDNEERIARLLRSGSVHELILEAHYWLGYYQWHEDADEALPTAMLLLECASEKTVV
ncbi:hypothetical protein [Dictyobacter kobayashii]|uniref:Uncharacterized protein n=1 Tax=Dictyobacter kobayashii TaxID=2014872 RepID=A0A402ATV2_9CHLR|nr:hypothetical protein [Dictyobacter kobayashii]GCE22453.1 hypothetical protein KDK_62530 [Dictyobacter kobayashii]